MANVASAASNGYWAYVGNYGESQPQGIFLLRFDPATESLAWVAMSAESRHPNFVIVHPNGRFLYAVSAVKLADYTGAVEAYALDPGTGALTFINRQPSGGDNPCHLAIDPTGKLMIVANYSGGNIAAFPLAPDGHIQAASTVVQHKGSSVNPRRQSKPYAHGVVFDQGGRTILVTDLGMDRVLAYDVDAAAGKLTALSGPGQGGTVPPGSGPRHLALRPDGRFAYVINELTCTVSVFSYRTPGMMQEIETIAPWPKVDKASGAEIEVHPNGRFVYASNRGHDSIAVCAVDSGSGRLSVRALVPSGGKTPRHFGLDPTGNFLLASNQDSDNVVVFRVEDQGEKLTPTGHSVKALAPVCVALTPIRA